LEELERLHRKASETDAKATKKACLPNPARRQSAFSSPAISHEIGPTILHEIEEVAEAPLDADKRGAARHAKVLQFELEDGRKACPERMRRIEPAKPTMQRSDDVSR
jgi:hypothetical protein